MEREAMPMLILEADIQKKVEQVKYAKLQVESGN